MLFIIIIIFAASFYSSAFFPILANFRCQMCSSEGEDAFNKEVKWLSETFCLVDGRSWS